MQKHISTDISKEGPRLQPLLSFGPILTFITAVETLDQDMISCGSRNLEKGKQWAQQLMQGYWDKHHGWLQKQFIFRSATKIKLQEKKQKQLYLMSTDPRVMQCVPTCLPGLQTQAVGRPTMPFVEFILHWLLNKPANEAAGCRYHTVLPLWLQFTSPWD